MSVLLDNALSALQVKKGSYGKVRSCTDSLVGAASIKGIAFVLRMVVTCCLFRGLCCSNATLYGRSLQARPKQKVDWKEWSESQLPPRPPRQIAIPYPPPSRAIGVVEVPRCHSAHRIFKHQAQKICSVASNTGCAHSCDSVTF